MPCTPELSEAIASDGELVMSKDGRSAHMVLWNLLGKDKNCGTVGEPPCDGPPNVAEPS